MFFTKDNYVSILGFMVIPEENGGLGLKGNELLVYAVIYGFSQDHDSWFSGSQSYLARWCNSTRQGIQKNLDSLIKKGLIEKRTVTINGTTYNNYRSCHPANSVCTPCQQSLHHNIEHNITPSDIDTNVSISSPPKGSKSFVKPTVEEVRAYCAERRNGIDPEAFIDHYEANGWRVGKTPMKDWKAALRNWERQRRARGELPPTERRMRGFDD